MTCSACGASLILDTRQRRQVCDPCRREPAVCPCRPFVSAFVPEWRKRNLAKIFDHGRAA